MLFWELVTFFSKRHWENKESRNQRIDVYPASVRNCDDPNILIQKLSRNYAQCGAWLDQTELFILPFILEFFCQFSQSLQIIAVVLIFQVAILNHQDVMFLSFIWIRLLNMLFVSVFKSLIIVAYWYYIFSHFWFRVKFYLANRHIKLT